MDKRMIGGALAALIVASTGCTRQAQEPVFELLIGLSG